MRPVTQPCGTRAAYARGCRCDACRAANRAYHREHRYGTGPEPVVVGPAPPGPWVDRAACRGADTDRWFPVRGDRASTGRLRAICGACPVRPECLEWAVDQNIKIGFYGGHSPRDRRPLVAERREKTPA